MNLLNKKACNVLQNTKYKIAVGPHCSWLTGEIESSDQVSACRHLVTNLPASERDHHHLDLDHDHEDEDEDHDHHDHEDEDHEDEDEDHEDYNTNDDTFG